MNGSARRLQDLRRFYTILNRLEEIVDGPRCLFECTEDTGWPDRGVYFFQEEGEYRTDTGEGLRIVPVGTHAITANARTTLWRRLYAHSIGRSVFGGHVRRALAERDETDHLAYAATEISNMPLLWLTVDDDAGPNSDRDYIERNAIAILSNYKTKQIDPPSREWLGHFSSNDKVARSGLWNSNHVANEYDPDFLDVLENWVQNETPN